MGCFGVANNNEIMVVALNHLGGFVGQWEWSMVMNGDDWWSRP